MEWENDAVGGELQPRVLPATAGDAELLWDFLAIAAYEPDAAAARAIPMVAAHLSKWPRRGDFGVVARVGDCAVGAAWARQFTLDEQPAFFVDDQTPEISVGVSARVRGQGIGTILLRSRVADARARGLGLCLNVRDSNPALRLHERVGFRRVPGSEVRNRVGGLSIGMVLPRHS